MTTRSKAIWYIVIGTLVLLALYMVLESRVVLNTTDPGKPVFIYAPVPTPVIIEHTEIVTVEQTITIEVMVDGPAPAPVIIGESLVFDKEFAVTAAQKPAEAAPPVPTGDAGQKLEVSWPLQHSYEALAWYEGGKKTSVQITTPGVWEFFTAPLLCANGGCIELKKSDPVNDCTVYAVPSAGWEPVSVQYCQGSWKLSVTKGGIARF